MNAESGNLDSLSHMLQLIKSYNKDADFLSFNTWNNEYKEMWKTNQVNYISQMRQNFDFGVK